MTTSIVASFESYLRSYSCNAQCCMGIEQIIMMIVEVDKILSENMYLKPGITKNGRLYYYKPPRIKGYQKAIRNQLEKYKKKLSSLTPPLKLTLIFVINEKRNKKTDLTNMTKLVEDVIKEITGIDDSNHYIVNLVKIPVRGLKREYILINVSEL